MYWSLVLGVTICVAIVSYLVVMIKCLASFHKKTITKGFWMLGVFVLALIFGIPAGIVYFAY